MALPDMARPASIDDVIDRISRIPDAYREFSQTVPADRSFGIGEELLAELSDRGLPSAGSGARRRFDRHDLLNIGIALGLPSASWRRMQLWARAIDVLAGQHVARYQLRMTVECPDPGHRGPCPLELNPCVADALPAGALQPEPGGFVMAPVIAAGDEVLPSLTGLLAEMRTLRFHLLPPALSADLEFASRTGLADPHLATRVLLGAAERLGLGVRPAAGMILMRPTALPHEWLEVRQGGSWFAADPFMLTVLGRWGLLDPASWPPTRSLPPLAWRLFPRWKDGAARHIAGQGLITHAGAWARMNLLVLRHQPVPRPDTLASSS